MLYCLFRLKSENIDIEMAIEAFPRVDFDDLFE